MRVLIVCNAGRTAAMLAKKVNKEMAFHGVVATVEAEGVSVALREVSGFDALLLAPQVSYTKRDFEKAADPTSMVYVVTQADYERQNAKKVANDVLAALGE